jgi:hypothetical protein
LQEEATTRTNYFYKFEDLKKQLAQELYINGSEVEVGEWQSLRNQGTPMESTYELAQCVFRYPMPASAEDAQLDICPNLPWAEDHFQERVSGKPLNPGEQYKYWPWYNAKSGEGVEEHRRVGRGPEGQTFVDDKFSHTYMERYWPKYFNGAFGPIMDGIRYEYGDLQDVVDLLVRSPYTRQAVLPVWFPEDTGAVHGERVPCSLTYQFLLRNGLLHCTYSIRSCDYFRHFHNDVYLTVRLVQWVCKEAFGQDVDVDNPTAGNLVGEVEPGMLKMDIGSLHIFSAELKRLEKESK